MGKKSAYGADTRGSGGRAGNGSSRSRNEATRPSAEAKRLSVAGYERTAGAKRGPRDNARDSADERSSAARQPSRKPVSARKGAAPAFDFPFPPDKLLARGLAELGFPEVDGTYRAASVRGIQSIIPLVSRYIKELELFNAAFDLVGAEPGTDRGRSDLVVRHILDSLAPWKEIAAEAARVLGVSHDADSPAEGAREVASAGVAGMIGAAPADGAAGGFAESVSVPAGAGTSDVVPADGASAAPVPLIADVGSGAGFPGIPLAIAFPNFRFTLVERMSKRCAFLENCVAILGLKNVTVLNSEMEKAPTDRFDVVVFRAFRPLDREMVRGLLALTRSADGSRASGILAAWKARADKIAVEMEGIADELDGWRVLPVTVPFLAHEERNLVVTASAKRPSRPR